MKNYMYPTRRPLLYLTMFFFAACSITGNHLGINIDLYEKALEALKSGDDGKAYHEFLEAAENTNDEIVENFFAKEEELSKLKMAIADARSFLLKEVPFQLRGQRRNIFRRSNDKNEQEQAFKIARKKSREDSLKAEKRLKQLQAELPKVTEAYEEAKLLLKEYAQGQLKQAVPF